MWKGCSNAFSRRRDRLREIKHQEDQTMRTQHSLTRWSPQALAVLRIMTALLFIAHGTQKHFAFPPSDNPGTVELFSLMGLAGTLELVGGLLILIGLFTRPVAFVLSGFMAAAYFMAHAPQNFYPVNNGGDAAILYCFVFLYFVFAGPGAWSVDESMRDRRSLA
jgi:putative oxidoreductase